MKLTRGNKYMFQAVKCHAYLRRVKDGRYFWQPDKEEKPWLKTYVMIDGYDADGQEIQKECEEYDGSEQLYKTYYERTAKEFCGVVVATTMITVNKRLFADTCQPEYGNDYRYIGEEPPEKNQVCAGVLRKRQEPTRTTG